MELGSVKLEKFHLASVTTLLITVFVISLQCAEYGVWHRPDTYSLRIPAVHELIRESRQEILYMEGESDLEIARIVHLLWVVISTFPTLSQPLWQETHAARLERPVDGLALSTLLGSVITIEDYLATAYYLSVTCHQLAAILPRWKL